jgi:DNA polymerase I
MGAQTGSMYVIDAHALIYQMFHAIRDQMSAPDGRPTNAVFGFTRDLMYLHDDVQPEYLVCAFDRKEPTFRDSIYEAYKKNRPEPPSDLVIQVPMIQEVVRAMNLPCLSVIGYEADDIMATLAVRGVEQGLNVYLCTTDKDCRQAINEKVRCYNLRKRLTMDAAWLMEEWGVRPEQVVDFQTMVGDSVDNVPGVPGVGEKTAAKLLQQYGSLEEIIKNVDAISGAKMKLNFKKSIETGDLERSRSLVRLATDVPLDIDWEDWKRREWDYDQLLDLFTSFGFRRFSDRVRSAAKKSTGFAKNAEYLAAMGLDPVPEVSESAEPGLFDGLGDGDDFEFGANAPKDSWEANYYLIDSEQKFEDFFQQLQRQSRFALDLETTGMDPLQSEIVGMAFSWHAGEAFYLPLMAPKGEQHLDATVVLAALKPILESELIAKVNQNIKYDWLAFSSVGITLRGIRGDSMIAHYLLHASDRSHDLDTLTKTYFHHDNIPITDLIGKGRNQKRMDEVSTEQVCRYAGEDADAAIRLTDRLEEELDPTLRKLYDEIEVPLIEVLAEMEGTGIRIDVPFLQGLSVTMAEQLETIEKQIHQAAGREFNISSPKQMREVLFEELRLPIQKRTDETNEPSTDQESLEKLARLDHEKAFIARLIVEHRQVAKLKGTYVDALPELVNPKTGRVHTSFNQSIAATGRLSSSNPNLQNVPTRTDQGKQIRQAFRPREGWKLITADYSQIELRLLTHFCGDEALQQAFLEDKDVHASVAAEVYKVPESEVTSAQRRVAKMINFGVIYGMSAFGLAERLEMKRTDAEKFIKAYFDRFSKVLAYQDALLARTRKLGYVATILGRRRPFDARAIRGNSSYRSRNQAEREAINMEIQGSAADLMKLALINIHRKLRLDRLESKMLLTVHDEIVLESPLNEVDQVSDLVRSEMNGAMNLAVPLKVDLGIGENWLDIE